MFTSRVRRRPRSARRLSWLVVVAMVLAALLVPSTAGGALASSPVAASGTRILLGSQQDCDRQEVHSGHCPSGSPSASPSGSATNPPTGGPSGSPDSSPSGSPDSTPSGSPDSTPSGSPDSTPSGSPDSSPSGSPDSTPSGSPDSSPSGSPDSTPSGSPDSTPSGSPDGTPSGSPSGDAQASILIAKFDNKGTEDLLDDTPLDGATFEVYEDDGDELFDDTLDTLVFGPAVTNDGLVETGPLDPGWYWIVETVVPDGFTGSDPILVELNTDAAVTCIWDAAGLVDCVGNDGENEESSWTIVEVENTPEEGTEPGGSTLGETGTPNITLPPTDAVTGANDGGASQGWRLVILAMAGIIAAALLLTPARLVIRSEDRRR